jgi:hypothetical protein
MKCVAEQKVQDEAGIFHFVSHFVCGSTPSLHYSTAP